MANVQKQFSDFNDKIRLRRFDENQILREKRDAVRDRLDEKLPGVFKEHEEECPGYYYRNQGSYELDTGVVPLDGDFDIDQGIYFAVSTSDYPDPVVLKERVHEALDGHTKDVRIRRPCVTVQYQRGGEPVYHVDMAVYSDGAENTDGKSRLAVGRENSAEEYRKWEVSSPQALIDTIIGRFTTESDRKQFRRIVRYLKRWKDQNFSPDGNAAPLGIGLTVATYDDLRPEYSDPTAGTPDDLLAMRNLVRAILGRFTTGYDAEQGKVRRPLKVLLPVEPWNDLFEQMTDTQMTRFEEKLEQFRDALDAADRAVDPHDAAKELQKVLGDDFPVPEKKDTATQHATSAFVTSSNSA
ncbi:MAG TPA: hypothetical protein VHG28_13330 [Longimicrobiaceae bacterium]|nr:hypothetical protein [Longimicrobiaceae bacterium]